MPPNLLVIYTHSPTWQLWRITLSNAVHWQPIYRSYYTIRWTMDLWVRRIKGWRRIVATRSFGVLLPAVLLKRRVKCLQAPNLLSASWEKCRFMGQRQSSPRDTSVFLRNLRFEAASHSYWRSIFKWMKARGLKGLHKEMAFDRHS